MSDHGGVQYVSQYFHLLHMQGFHVFRVAWERILVFDGIGQVFYSRSLLVENLSAVHPLLPFSSEVWWKSGFVED